MIDDAVMMDYIRDANPVPNLDDLDPDELTRSAAATETRRAAVMQAPAQHPTEIQPTPPKRHLAGWAFAAAFIVVLVGVGIAALVLRTAEAPVSDEPVTETTVVDAPIEPSQLESLIWSRVSFDGNMSSVTVGGPGLVALGEADDHAAVWTSRDGYSWSRVPHDESVFGTDAVRWAMRSATAGGPGLVAVGSQLSGWGRPGGDAALVWTSPDGMSWTRVPHDAVFDEARMASVIAGGPGLVAVGSIGDSAAVWTSQDGETWSRSTVFDGNPARHPNDQLVVNDVTVGGPGLVAVGRDTSSASVWTSPDGNIWTPIPQDESVFGGEGIQAMSSVTVGGPGLVAVGGDYGRPAVWTSPDGYVWTRVPHDDAIFGVEVRPEWAPRSHRGYYDEEPMRDVIVTDAGLVAVGTVIVGAEADGDPLNDAIVWTSRDGRSWSRILYNEAGSTTDHETEPLGTPQNMRMESVTENGPVLVAVGTYSRGDRAAVWVAEP